MLRIPFSELVGVLEAALLPLGFAPERAAECARLFAETTRDGVYTHGLARFPRFVEMIRNGSVVPSAAATRVTAFGGLERWQGNAGPGNLNAWACMGRALALAREHGIGGVALAGTNHWMRGGTYGWQAAEAGCFALCWSNTLANLPAWGGTSPVLGNNPLVIAMPRPPGHVVLDMAMSQFSYGTLAAYRDRGEALPVPGGYDATGNLTTDAAAIEQSQRALPVGFWKGSGLALVLDLLAAMLSGGKATHQLPTDPLRESGQSQIFIAIDPAGMGDASAVQAVADAILASTGARYPGEKTLATREENMRLGVPVDPVIWYRLQANPPPG